MKDLITNKQILVTGGTGSIGTQLVKQLASMGPMQITAYARDEYKHFLLKQEMDRDFPKINIRYCLGDVRDYEKLERVTKNIDIVFHAAAIKHVYFAEKNPEEAIKTNVVGALNIINACFVNNVPKVIAISTDKAVNPTSVMGSTKLIMEHLLIKYSINNPQCNTKVAVVRFGNVLNSRGSLLPKWRQQIKLGGPVTVTDKRMKRFFMEIKDAVSLVITAAVTMKGGEIFVLKMPEYNIYELAKKTISQETTKKIDIIFTGSGSGEKICEELLTEMEKDRSEETESMWIIKPFNCL